jgi:hypothetical protein
MVLTKLVKLEWDIERTHAMYLAGKVINDRWIAEGKSDGVWEKNTDAEFGGQWKFVDQAAAEEHISAITAAGIANGRTLISSTITDI